MGEGWSLLDLNQVEEAVGEEGRVGSSAGAVVRALVQGEAGWGDWYLR